MLGIDAEKPSSRARNLRKISCKTFHRKIYFPWSREFVYNILSKVLGNKFQLKQFGFLNQISKKR